MEGEGLDREGGGEVGVDFGVVFWLVFFVSLLIFYTLWIVWMGGGDVDVCR